MKTGDYEWCMKCDGSGWAGWAGNHVCVECGGSGCVKVSKEQKAIDIAEAAKLQATVDEISKRIAGDTKPV